MKKTILTTLAVASMMIAVQNGYGRPNRTPFYEPVTDNEEGPEQSNTRKDRTGIGAKMQNTKEQIKLHAQHMYQDASDTFKGVDRSMRERLTKIDVTPQALRTPTTHFFTTLIGAMNDKVTQDAIAEKNGITKKGLFSKKTTFVLPAEHKQTLNHILALQKEFNSFMKTWENENLNSLANFQDVNNLIVMAERIADYRARYKEELGIEEEITQDIQTIVDVLSAKAQELKNKNPTRNKGAYRAIKDHIEIARALMPQQSLEELREENGQLRQRIAELEEILAREGNREQFANARSTAYDQTADDPTEGDSPVYREGTGRSQTREPLGREPGIYDETYNARPNANGGMNMRYPARTRGR